MYRQKQGRFTSLLYVDIIQTNSGADIDRVPAPVVSRQRRALLIYGIGGRFRTLKLKMMFIWSSRKSVPPKVNYQKKKEMDMYNLSRKCVFLLGWGWGVPVFIINKWD